MTELEQLRFDVTDACPLLGDPTVVAAFYINGRPPTFKTKVCHMLLDLPLANTSRTVVSVDCGPEIDQPIGFDAEGSRVVCGRTLLQKYKTRDVQYKDLTYHHILTRCAMSGRNIKPLARAATKDRIYRFFPMYLAIPQDVTSDGTHQSIAKLLSAENDKARIEEIRNSTNSFISRTTANSTATIVRADNHRSKQSSSIDTGIPWFIGSSGRVSSKATTVTLLARTFQTTSPKQSKKDE
jgi:hypothetical protein